MREILFRGKRIDNGEWIEGAYFPKNDNYPATIYIDDGLGTYVDPATVGQYTGLTDKNGKKIFEGDIVRHHNDNPYALPSIFEKGKVYWDEQYCGWRRTSNGAFHHGCVKTYRIAPDCNYEVIGNIYDNPELLEG